MLDDDVNYDCPACHGSGGGCEPALRCPLCHGTGQADLEPVVIDEYYDDDD